MYASIRVYHDAGSVDELARVLEEGFLPAISTMPGFRAYYAVEVGEGALATVSIFENPDGAEESNNVAADFIREDLSELFPNPPDITNGEVIACREV
jgi:hypothetical protein